MLVGEYVQIKKFFFGSDAEAIKGVLNINNPIENGVVNNWEDIKILWI